ncbi:hypothetical protein C2G38_2151934 [Gigaspora rosea]|uniref:Uncharacterized protein n=1 Tax=Gigaspora rosea TaxID=44941 RepID=A0A397W7I5_9GLOM|nr:hypothetical protein C2G38_2151934 [Gigaspora rosea]
MEAIPSGEGTTSVANNTSVLYEVQYGDRAAGTSHLMSREQLCENRALGTWVLPSGPEVEGQKFC